MPQTSSGNPDLALHSEFAEMMLEFSNSEFACVLPTLWRPNSLRLPPPAVRALRTAQVVGAGCHAFSGGVWQCAIAADRVAAEHVGVPDTLRNVCVV